LHKGIQKMVKDLNALYKKEKALYLYDVDRKGFEWIDYKDYQNNIISFIRKSDEEEIIVVCNFAPVERIDYKIGVNEKGFYKEIFNSDSLIYGGRNIGNLGGKEAEEIPMHGRNFSLSLTLPPLGVLYLKRNK